MTTSFPASSAYATPPNSQGKHQFSPVHTMLGTPAHVSPTSPHHGSLLPNLPLATRQLRPPKLPLYVPAVLRPTERAHRASPLTPPRSVHGSTDSLDDRDGGRPRSRRSTAESQPRVDDADRTPERSSPAEPTFGVVEGLPTRHHWKPDANAVICDAPTCHKSFNLFERRHHCRHCGHVFCNTDSHYTVPLDHHAEFHPEGSLSRACKHCWDRYCQWRTAAWARGNQDDTRSTTAPTTPVSGAGGKQMGGGGAGKGDDMLKGGWAGSAPRDWSWSTF